MKRYKFLLFYLFYLLSFSASASANAVSEIVAGDCDEKEKSPCEVYLKINRGGDDTSYKVELTNKAGDKKLFPYFDMNETMETVSLEKIGNKYVFLKQYLDSTKALEFITFSFKSDAPLNLEYYYLESSVDLKKGMKIWSGKKCETSAGIIPENTGSKLLQAASALCVNKAALSYETGINHEGNPNDALFYLTHMDNGLQEKLIPVLALDRKDTDSMSLSDIGCLAECGINTNSINYLGWLNRKIRVRLNVSYSNENISGFYYYDKFGKKSD